MERNTVKRPVKTNRRQKQKKKKEAGKLGWFMSKDINRNIPPREGEPARTKKKDRKKKKYIVEGTNKAEIRPQKQSKKAESCRENLWNEIQLKGR